MAVPHSGTLLPKGGPAERCAASDVAPLCSREAFPLAVSSRPGEPCTESSGPHWGLWDAQPALPCHPHTVTWSSNGCVLLSHPPTHTTRWVQSSFFPMRVRAALQDGREECILSWDAVGCSFLSPQRRAHPIYNKDRKCTRGSADLLLWRRRQGSALRLMQTELGLTCIVKEPLCSQAQLREPNATLLSPPPPSSSDFAFQGCASAVAHSDLFQCPEPRAALPCGVNTALCSCSHSAPRSAQAVLLLAAAALRWVLLCHLTSSQLCAGRSAEHRAPTRSRGSA